MGFALQMHWPWLARTDGDKTWSGYKFKEEGLAKAFFDASVTVMVEELSFGWIGGSTAVLSKLWPPTFGMVFQPISETLVPCRKACLVNVGSVTSHVRGKCKSWSKISGFGI